MRTESDYAEVAEEIRRVRPDIIALQEIGSIPAARRVLGEGYQVAFETRCLRNEHKCDADNDDIYIAIAFRNELAGRVTVFQVDSLAINHTDECGNTRPVRGGVGVKLDIGGRPTWVLSVHMKAACRTNNSQSRTPLDCATQRTQFDALKTWILGRPTGDAVIIAGDFNRALLNSKDRIRRSIFSALSNNVRLLPEHRTCWSGYRFNWSDLKSEARKNNPEFEASNLEPWIYSPERHRDIDFFMAINTAPGIRFESDQLQPPRLRFEKPRRILKKCDGTVITTRPRAAITFGDAYPSDHCLIVLKVNF